MAMKYETYSTVYVKKPLHGIVWCNKLSMRILRT